MSGVSVPVIADTASVDKLSVKELRAWLNWNRIDSSDCLEKSDLVSKVKSAVTERQAKAAASTAAAAAKPASAAPASVDRPISLAPNLRRLKSVSGAGRQRAQAVMDMSDRLVKLSEGFGSSDVLLRDMWVIVANYSVHYEHEWSCTDTHLLIGCGDSADEDVAATATTSGIESRATDAHDLDIVLQFCDQNVTAFAADDHDAAAPRRTTKMQWRRAWTGHQLNVCHTSFAIRIDSLAEGMSSKYEMFIGVNRSSPGTPTHPTAPFFQSATEADPDAQVVYGEGLGCYGLYYNYFERGLWCVGDNITESRTRAGGKFSGMAVRMRGPINQSTKSDAIQAGVVIGVEADLLNGVLRFWRNETAVSIWADANESATAPVEIVVPQLSECYPYLSANCHEASITILPWTPPAKRAPVAPSN